MNIAFYGVDAEILESSLDAKGILVSSGSACASNRTKSSHVLQALKNKKAIHCSIRFSLSKYTTKQEIKNALKIIAQEVKKLRE